MNLGTFILNFLLPPKCPICHQDIVNAHALCPKCFSELKFITKPVCHKCGRPLPHGYPDICGACLNSPPPYQRAYAPLQYNDTIKKLILPYKHGDLTELVHVLSQFLIQSYPDIIRECDIIIPVPLHVKRLFFRKYNQAGMIAQKLAQKFHKEYNPTVLKRIKNTQSQGHLTAKQRLQNMRGAFAIKSPIKITNKRILLIDDVITTESTIRACTKVLIKSGAKSVDILAVCRRIKN